MTTRGPRERICGCRARLVFVAGIGDAVNARERRGASQLVGRDAERSVLSGCLDAAAEGRGGAAVVVGEAGIGESRLLDVLAAEATDRGMVVLRGRAVEATTSVAYRPVAESLCSLVRGGRAPARGDLVPFDVLLGALIPDWLDAGAPVIEPSVVVVAEAVLRFLRATAGSVGCLLVLEDLHWADPETWSILDYLADNLASERVLCAASWRTHEPGDVGARSLGLPTSRAAETVVLDRLDDAAVATMVASCLDGLSVGDDVLALVARGGCPVPGRGGACYGARVWRRHLRRPSLVGDQDGAGRSGVVRRRRVPPSGRCGRRRSHRRRGRGAARPPVRVAPPAHDRRSRRRGDVRGAAEGGRSPSDRGR